MFDIPWILLLKGKYQLRQENRLLSSKTVCLDSADDIGEKAINESGINQKIEGFFTDKKGILCPTKMLLSPHHNAITLFIWSLHNKEWTKRG